MFPAASDICAAPWMPGSLWEGDNKDLMSHKEVNILFSHLNLFLNIHQVDTGSGAENSDDVDIGTPVSSVKQLLRRKIMVPMPQHADGQVRLVEHEFDYSYAEVCASFHSLNHLFHHFSV
jgi:hypothetical protein